MEKTNSDLVMLCEGIWHTKGKARGLTFIVSGGIHGNEKTGVRVVARLKEDVESGKLRVISGSLYLILGNLRAIELDERYTNSRVDLNRCFTDNLTEAQQQSYEASRAKAIMNALGIEAYPPDSVIGVDIHSTNTPSKPFLVSQKNPTHLTNTILPYLKTAEALLCDPHLIFEGELLTTDEYYARRGIGLCYETGHADDTSRTEIIYNEIVALGTSLGVLESDSPTIHAPHVLPPIYTLRESIILTDEGFEYAPLFGDENFVPFSQGTIIGHHGSRPVIASFNGVFVFPKLKKHWEVGKSLGYLTEMPS